MVMYNAVRFDQCCLCTLYVRTLASTHPSRVCVWWIKRIGRKWSSNFAIPHKLETLYTHLILVCYAKWMTWIALTLKNTYYCTMKVGKNANGFLGISVIMITDPSRSLTMCVLCARHQMSNSLMRKTCYFRTNSIHINITHLRKYHVWRKPSRAPLSVSWYSSAIDISGPFVVWQNVLCLACPQYNRLLHKYNYARRYTHEYTRPAVLHALYAKRGLKDKLTHQIESRECWKISVIESICPHMCHVCVCVCCCCCCLIGRLRFPSPKFSLSWHVMHVWVSAYACMCSLCYIMMRVWSRSPPAGIADADHRHCCYCCWSVWKCFEHIHVQREYIVNMQITWITTVRIEHVACSVQFYFYLIAFSYHSIYYIYYIEMLLSIFLFFVCFILWILLRLVKEATHALCCPAIISDWVPVINLKNKNNMTTTIWL